MMADMPESMEAYLRRLLGDADDGGLADVAPADEEWLSQAAEEALQGIDIRQRYPLLWQRLLTQRQLRTSFLELVAMLEAMTQDSYDSVELEGEVLEQLRRLPPGPQHKQYARDRWEVTWRHTSAQLDYLLTPRPADQSRYRRALDAPAGRKVVLLRTEEGVHVETGRLMVFLELEQHANGLTDDVVVLVSFEPEPECTSWPRLQVSLSWGAYRQTLPLTQDAATFTSIPRPATVVEGGPLFHPLELTIATLVED